MNAYSTVICLLALVAIVSAYPPGPLPLVPIATIGERVPHYKFEYAVNDPSTGDNKAQWESRSGDVVRGAYTLVEPDGNRRLVEYSADSLHGFNANVRRTGPHIHSITPVVTQIQHVAPIAHIAPAAHVEHIEPIAHIEPVAHLEHHAPIAHIEPVTHVEHHAPIAHIQPVAHVEHHAAIAHIEPVAHVEHHAPITHIEPIRHVEHVAPISHIEPAHVAPVIPGPVITPVIETEPVVVHQPDVHVMPVHSSPLVTLSGTTYGHRGIARRWAAGPISLDGKTLTISTKHH